MMWRLVQPGAGRALVLAAALALAWGATGLGAAEESGRLDEAAPPTEAATAGPETVEGSEQASTDYAEDVQVLEREGLRVEFTAVPALGRFEGGRDLMRGDRARLRFKITDQETGEPVSGLYPGAWMDLKKTATGEASETLDCKERISLYLSGTTGMRPLLDMNSYFILAMNNDASISVIDPAVLVAGVPDNFFTQILLRGPGGDWTKSAEDKLLYVSVPTENVVAVVNAANFKVEGYVDVGTKPLRVALQPDGRYLWVANNGERNEQSGVTVVDTESREPVTTIETGTGHHELAFSSDSRFAFVSNRTGGTVTIIDVENLEVVRQVDVGEVAIDVAYSSSSELLYAVDAAAGAIRVIDPETGDQRARIDLDPGLGPLEFAEGGRWGFVVNPGADEVHIIDASDNSRAHTVGVEGRPYQVGFSRSFAYVRAIGTSKVAMIDLSELEGNDLPPVHGFDTGNQAPGQAKRLSIASTLAASPVDAGMIALNPGDDRLYFYMEGANWPKGSFRSYGHSPRAVTIVDRALREADPGVYQSEAKIPKAGTYNIAFVLEAPPVLHCFTMEADVNPLLAEAEREPVLRLAGDDRNVVTGEPQQLRLRLWDPNTEQYVEGLEDLQVRYFRAPGFGRTEVAATEVEPGVYAAEVLFRRPGAYYVYVSVPSRELGFADLPFITLRGVRATRPVSDEQPQ